MACDFCLGIDLFPRRIQLRLPSGRDKFRTCRGACLSLIYMIIVIGVGALYSFLIWRDYDEQGLLEANENEDSDFLSYIGVEEFGGWFKLIVRLLGDIGGLAVVLYVIFLMIARCCTRNLMEDYLVTELFAGPAETATKMTINKDIKKEDKEGDHMDKSSDRDKPTLKAAKALRQGKNSPSFYNEIIHSDEDVLNANQADGLGLKKSYDEMMSIGRQLCQQELNITRLVASSRSTQLMKGLLGHSLLNKQLKRTIPSSQDQTRSSKYSDKKAKKIRIVQNSYKEANQTQTVSIDNQSQTFQDNSVSNFADDTNTNPSLVTTFNLPKQIPNSVSPSAKKHLDDDQSSISDGLTESQVHEKLQESKKSKHKSARPSTQLDPSHQIKLTFLQHQQTAQLKSNRQREGAKLANLLKQQSAMKIVKRQPLEINKQLQKLTYEKGKQFSEEDEHSLRGGGGGPQD